jgi:hypothetical protein
MMMMIVMMMMMMVVVMMMLVELSQARCPDREQRVQFIQADGCAVQLCTAQASRLHVGSIMPCCEPVQKLGRGALCGPMCWKSLEPGSVLAADSRLPACCSIHACKCCRRAMYHRASLVDMSAPEQRSFTFHILLIFHASTSTATALVTRRAEVCCACPPLPNMCHTQ